MHQGTAMILEIPSDINKLLVSVVVGGCIGLEREYSSKAAGFRSIMLICLGSTLFTIVSQHLGVNGNADRIAANIITGIGFIGAGVVFKDGVSITGITTASSIWSTAALGMAIGVGEYETVAIGLILVLLVLRIFEKVENVVDRYHQVRSYRIVLKGYDNICDELEKKISSTSLRYQKKRQTKTDSGLVLAYEISGGRDRIESFSSYLLEHSSVASFEC